MWQEGREMNNIYTIAFTVYDTTKPDEKPQHKKFTFESEYDLLAAADDGMCQIFDKYEEGKSTQVLFRSITLDNAQEIYKELTKGSQDEQPTSTSTTNDVPPSQN
jgi:hypothetical protein